MRLSDTLDTKAADIQRPPNPPLGTYQWQIRELPKEGQMSSKGTQDNRWDTLEFSVVCIAATDDVDPTDLEAYGDLQKIRQRKFFMLDTTDDVSAQQTLVNIKDFLLACGAMNEKDTIAEGIANSPNCTFLASLAYRPDPNDPEVIYTELGRKAFPV